MDGAFEIYSLADGLFLYRVLNAVAMLGNGGQLAAVAAIGMLAGLLMIAVSAIVSGGKEFPLQQLLISYILFLVLFGTRTTVVIHETAPSLTAPAPVSRVVDNVPWGIAVAGSLVSRFTYELTELTETAFSTPEGQGITESGFGKVLDVIAMGRAFKHAQLAGLSDPEWYGQFRQSLVNYIADCTLTGVTAGIITQDQLWNTDDPLEGFRFNSHMQTTETDLHGERRYVDCVEGFEVLQAESERLGDVVNGALSLHVGVPNASAALERAYGAIGLQSVADIRQYAIASMLLAVYDEAAAGSMITSPRAQTAMMIKQAEEQRQVQWAAEATLFMKIVRPLQAFFESFAYTLAPFMAFVLGLGALGLRLLMKYFVLTLWCSLFGVVLAVINLFATTQLEQFVQVMAQGGAGQPTSMTSVLAIARMSDEAMNALAFASTLAAATPAITMVLMFGGAVAGTFLASRLQGGDHVKEQQVSPDAQNIAALQNYDAIRTINPATGSILTGTGSQAMSLDLSQVASHTQASAFSEKQAASEALSTRTASSLAASLSNAGRFSEGWSASVAANSSAGKSALANEAKSLGFGVDDAVSGTSSADSRNSQTSGINAQALMLLAGALPMVKDGRVAAAAVADSARKMGVGNGLLGALGLAGATAASKPSFGTQANLARTSTEDFSRSDRQAAGMVQQFARRIEASDTLRAEFAETVAKARTYSGSQEAATSIAVNDSRELARAAADLREKSETYSEATEARKAWQHGRHLSDVEWAQGLSRSSEGREAIQGMVADAQQLVGTRAWEANLAQARAMHGVEGKQAHAVAAIRTLVGGGWDGDVYDSGAGGDERRMAVANALQAGGFVPHEIGHASANEGISGGVEFGIASSARSATGPSETRTIAEAAFDGTYAAATGGRSDATDRLDGDFATNRAATQQDAQDTYDNEVRPESDAARQNALDHSEASNERFGEIRRERSVIGDSNQVRSTPADEARLFRKN